MQPVICSPTHLAAAIPCLKPEFVKRECRSSALLAVVLPASARFCPALPASVHASALQCLPVCTLLPCNACQCARFCPALPASARFCPAMPASVHASALQCLPVCTLLPCNACQCARSCPALPASMHAPALHCLPGDARVHHSFPKAITATSQIVFQFIKVQGSSAQSGA